MGRPTKLTPEVQRIIITALEAGHYADDAAILGGISEDTYYEWVKRGRAGDEPYKTFSEAVESASRKAVERALVRVQDGDMGWQGSAWFLERRYPAKWGRRDPDHALKTKQLQTDLERSQVEIETLKQKLELLKQGHDPDAQEVIVVTRGWKKEDA